MKFHGRIHPGRLLDLKTPVEVRIHQPRKCAGVTIKIWELDAFIGADGKPRREGTPDDLLATFTGAIEPAPAGGGRSPEWRTFKVDSAKIEEAPEDAVRFLLRFPGSPTTYEVPILSEDGEIEGTEYELGFSIEVGGAEKFRTRSPCLLAMPRTVARVRELLIIGFDENGEPVMDEAEEVPPSFDRVALGKAPTTTEDPKEIMPVLATARVHPSGIIIADEDGAPNALGVNVSRKLAVVAHRKGEDASKPLAAAATPIAKDGVIEVLRADRAFTATMYLSGAKPSFATKDGHPHVTFDGDSLGEDARGAPALATRQIVPAPRRKKGNKGVNK